MGVTYTMDSTYDVQEIVEVCEEIAPTHVWKSRFVNRSPDRLEIYCDGCGAKFLTPWAWDGPVSERHHRVRTRVARYSDCRLRMIKWIHAM